MDDIAADIPDAGRAYLTSKLHCNGCSKVEINPKEFANFIIVFWSGIGEAGEPIVRDGIFDENGRIAILKACQSCGPKVKKLHKGYSFKKMNQLAHLNDGPLKKMLSEIWKRRKAEWKLEIGWEILLPILQQLKASKMDKIKGIEKSKALERH